MTSIRALCGNDTAFLLENSLSSSLPPEGHPLHQHSAHEACVALTDAFLGSSVQGLREVQMSP